MVAQNPAEHETRNAAIPLSYMLIRPVSVEGEPGLVSPPIVDSDEPKPARVASL